MTSFYLYGTFYHQHAGSLLKLCQTFEAQRESVNGGKLFSARSDLSQPRGISLWGNEEDLPQGCMQTGDSVHKYMFVSKCSI